MPKTRAGFAVLINPRHGVGLAVPGYHGGRERFGVSATASLDDVKLARAARPNRARCLWRTRMGGATRFTGYFALIRSWRLPVTPRNSRSVVHVCRPILRTHRAVNHHACVTRPAWQGAVIFAGCKLIAVSSCGSIVVDYIVQPLPNRDCQRETSAVVPPPPPRNHFPFSRASSAGSRRSWVCSA